MGPEPTAEATAELLDGLVRQLALAARGIGRGAESAVFLDALAAAASPLPPAACDAAAASSSAAALPSARAAAPASPS